VWGFELEEVTTEKSKRNNKDPGAPIVLRINKGRYKSQGWPLPRLRSIIPIVSLVEAFCDGLLDDRQSSGR